ncbi:MAG TPA: aminotransferase class I/II-fold pyridoxal phosphate-dependent enzyme [Acholeplasmataceae bacterium]|jgi:aromatic-amino-acid transaminase|nr:aminotransferase class I/II-fold pyridoxal phosphate-dependent enzyme [Acholeplasmataceae bacterium]
MGLISKRAAGKALLGDGFSFSQQAKAARRAGFDVLDATLGTFYYDDGSFRGYRTVKEILASMPDEDRFSYAPITGGERFTSAVLDWVFREHRAQIEENLAVKVVPTPGGTGAISSAVHLTLDRGESALLPDLAWGPYVGILAESGVGAERFPLFQGDAFNFARFCEKGDELAGRFGKLAVILNDPCHNPTGYTLSPEELERLIAYLNGKNTPCVLIYDIAYLDYDGAGREAARAKLRLLTQAAPHVLIAIAFSASKSFCAYGQRLGALILLGRDTATVKTLYDAMGFHARHTWSNTNRAMITLMTALASDENRRRALDAEIEVVAGQLHKRAEAFRAEAQDANLPVHPYHGGFFLTVPVADNERVVRELQENEHYFFLPFHQSIRVAICAVPLARIKGLAATIRKYCPDRE